MFLVLLLYALFASVFTFAKYGLEYAQPFFLVGSRMFIAGIILIAYQLYKNREQIDFKKLPYGKIFMLAAFNIYLTNVFEFWGLQYLTSFKTCFIYSLSPFLSALLSYFVFAETLSTKKWIGLMVGFAGFIPILLNGTSSEESTGHLFFLSWAEIAVMLAASCSVYGWILLKQLVKDEGLSPLTANGISMLIGGIMALSHSYVAENWNPLPMTQFVPVLECTIALVIISNLICYNLYGVLLKKYSATFISFAGFTTPLFTALYGWVFLSETVTMPFYISTAIVFAGLFTFYQEELQRDYYAVANTTSN